ncbi:MAG TPA: aromatic ring-hydroxylating dioxygenase subunit alpha [Steroidobacteraceae bacterium]|nr:aromatic ring-hydroxylating dioxygenase subunit alpha [Steroidobacteraceae bacterium]
MPAHPIAALLASRRPDFALPAAFFTDEAVYEAELDWIFARHWLFLASEPEIPEGGDYRTFQVGRYPIFVLRRDDGSIAAFHNSCRHRGSRILQQAAGVVGANLVCPYHRWTYDTAGRVIHCGTTGAPGPETTQGLGPVHIRQLAGLIFVCLAAEPPEDFEEFAARMRPYLEPHAVAQAKVARQIDLVEHGNWKLTIENNRECFHCGGHPELLNSLFHFLGDVTADSLSEQERSVYRRYEAARERVMSSWARAGLPWQRLEHLHDRPTGFRAERLVLEGHGESMTVDTRVACRRLLGSLADPRLGTLHLHVQPNAWFHFMSDHIITFSVLPLARESTLVRTTWLVNAEAQEGKDYDVENLTRVWIATNHQDAHFVEETQRGVASPAYVPGPLGSTEFLVDLFHRWYEGRMRTAMAQDAPQRPPREISHAAL